MSDREDKEKKKGENDSRLDDTEDEDLTKYSELDDSTKKLLVYAKAIANKSRQGASPKSYSKEKSDPAEENKKYVHRLLGFIPEESESGRSEELFLDKSGSDETDLKEDRGQKVKNAAGKSDKREEEDEQAEREQVKERPRKEHATRKTDGSEEVSRERSNAENQPKNSSNFMEEKKGNFAKKKEIDLNQNKTKEAISITKQDAKEDSEHPESSDKTRSGGRNAPRGKGKKLDDEGEKTPENDSK